MVKTVWADFVLINLIVIPYINKNGPFWLLSSKKEYNSQIIVQ